jgi:glycosyltransferase involved in cell wall biosynthesis
METTSGLEKEIIIWDNGSTDGTRKYINDFSKKYDFIKTHFSETNVGVNAKGLGFELAKGNYTVCLDDDILMLPERWVEKMIEAFEAETRLGYLALDVMQNEHTTGAKLSEDEYIEKKYPDGMTLQFGPVGGWCFMIPRKVYEVVGKLRQVKGKVFFGEDGDYIIRCRLKGFKSAILKDVKCFHATGPYYNENYKFIFENKMKDWNSDVIDSHTIKRKANQLVNKIKKFRRKNNSED